MACWRTSLQVMQSFPSASHRCIASHVPAAAVAASVSAVGPRSALTTISVKVAPHHSLISDRVAASPVFAGPQGEFSLADVSLKDMRNPPYGKRVRGSAYWGAGSWTEAKTMAESNTACRALRGIAGAKDDTAEAADAGKSFKDLEPARLPPCVQERGGFMAPLQRPLEFGSSLPVTHESGLAAGEPPAVRESEPARAPVAGETAAGCTASPRGVHRLRGGRRR